MKATSSVVGLLSRKSLNGIQDCSLLTTRLHETCMVIKVGLKKEDKCPLETFTGNPSEVNFMLFMNSDWKSKIESKLPVLGNIWVPQVQITFSMASTYPLDMLYIY